MQHLIQTIISFIKTKPPEFFQFKKIHGRTTGIYKEDHIELDFRKDLIQTIIHECIHAIHPELSETKVIQTENKIMKVITNSDVAEILFIVAKKIKYTELHQSFLKRQ
ncbi:hypothetical protein UFOVP760_48 [uncultured Caudovirales phage]|uniref:Uncharacterized protein n=1 Tax=uncultured Caudovirales phage TaxID=2100421 RepID=A0A6J7X6N0_9CAUD|nr:hypothetical protein UFOVP760_48 [uncultured Caudovirales phage]